MINKKGISLHPQSSNNDGAIAQLVEQRTENPCVPGSIPGGTTLSKQNPDFVLKSLKLKKEVIISIFIET